MATIIIENNNLYIINNLLSYNILAIYLIIFTIKFCLLFSSCASLAKLGDHRFFGVQNYRECWTGELTSEYFDISEKAKKCWGVRPNYTECNDNAETKCIGPHDYNYIYEIISGT